MTVPARRSRTPIPHARRHFYALLARSVRPRPLTTVSAWSDKYRILTSKGSGEPGQWRTDRTPYLRQILDALSVNSPAQRIVLNFSENESTDIPATRANRSTCTPPLSTA